ncbi:Acetyltransferase (GNAT) family protein [Mesorhizobium albiziae]|uniref:Acetyltransferase (GNAT) family protein n=2 Tax=Neomesorhizobium albiziae TaxID=335020 RepID=A0A1I4EC34_9HYPH|nr:Acetyltransferase (GNAT) family protein [Mesorhizobium albiziae]
MAVYLRPLTFSERQVVDAIELDAEQQRFAGGSLDDIFHALDASAHPAALHPFCLVADQAVVGFLVLREGPARPVWALDETITLHSLRVSKPFQRRGFGACALRLAGQWIKAERPTISHVMLTVNADNPDASVLYLRCGFQPTGTIFQGRIGRERVMICAIDKIAEPQDSGGG